MQVEQEGPGGAVARGRGLKGLWTIPVLLVAFRAKGLSSESRPECQLITVDTHTHAGSRQASSRGWEDMPAGTGSHRDSTGETLTHLLRLIHSRPEAPKETHLDQHTGAEPIHTKVKTHPKAYTPTTLDCLSVFLG